MIDIRQSQNYASYLKSQGWIVERVAEINYFIKKFPLMGSVLKVQRPEEIRIDTIRKLARKYRAFQIIVEPKTEMDAKFLTSVGFKLSKSPYLPTKTLQIDLTQSQKAIFSHFKKDTRAIIKKFFDSSNSLRTNNREVKNSIHRYSSPKDIVRWREAWKNSVKFNRWVPNSDQLINLRKSFPDNYSLFLASHNISGRIIGGALFTHSSHESSNYISYYWYGFTNKEGRTSLSQYSLLYNGILWAKKQGCKVFDFEGIYDPRFPNKSWLGFTHFKRSFGGYEVEYPECYINFRLPL
jgi:lipid II:glycine glycyltransferase (peptidoglycan interpeptide bridge formation enzyme)